MLSFEGSVQFVLEQVPSNPIVIDVVPAPGALLLATLGLGCLRWLRTRERL